MTIDEAIKHAEEVADVCEFEVIKYDMTDAYESHVACQEGKCAEEHRQLAKWLKELKRLRNQTRWIPVSERLPDIDGEEYLVYRKTDTFVKRPFCIDIARWYSDDTENNGFNKYSEVIAWMPLPKPYKEEEE